MPLTRPTWPRSVTDALVVVRCEDPSTIPGPVASPDVELRELDLRHGPTLDAWLDAHAAAFGVQWTRDDHRRAFDDHPVITVLATSGAFDLSGRLIGAASVATYRGAPSVGLVHYIFVRPEVQDHGVGAALLRHRYADLVARGIDAIECQTHLHRTASLTLHFAHGFVPKYRFDAFNSPDRSSGPARALANRRLRALYERWRAHSTAGAAGGR